MLRDVHEIIEAQLLLGERADFGDPLGVGHLQRDLAAELDRVGDQVRRIWL